VTHIYIKINIYKSMASS